MTTTRRCEETGLHLIASPGILGYHVGKLEYPDAADIITLSPDPILVTDDALRTAAERFRIRVF